METILQASQETVAVAVAKNAGGKYPTPMTIRFIEPGLVHYEYLNNNQGATVLVQKAALDKMMSSFVGKPVVNKAHRDVSPEDYKLGNADGIVSKVWYDAQSGWFNCEALIWDEETKANIKNGYSVSCEYRVKEWGKGGLRNNVPYEKEVLDGEYAHLAIVPNPRYEGARILMNSKGGNTMKLMFWKKDEKEQEIKNSVEIESDKSVIDFDGKEISLTDAVAAFQEKQTREAEALANAKQKLDDEATITVGDRKVKVLDLKNAYAEKMKNDEDSKMAEDHKDGKHKEENSKCSMCNKAKNDADEDEKKKADDEKKKAKEKADEEEKAKNAAGKETFREIERLANERSQPQQMPLPKSRREMAEQGKKDYGSPVLAVVEQ